MLLTTDEEHRFCGSKQLFKKLWFSRVDFERFFNMLFVSVGVGWGALGMRLFCIILVIMTALVFEGRHFVWLLL